MGPSRFSVAVNGIVAVCCEVVCVGLADFGVMVLELDSSFWGCFCLDVGGVKEWASGEMVSMVDVTNGFLWGAGVGDVSWMKLQMSISLMYSFTLASKISFIPFLMEKGSGRNEIRGRG